MRLDQLFVNGTVWPGDDPSPSSDALGLSRGRIVALGDQARDLRGPRTEVVDLAGGFLMAAFGDAHAHPVFGALERLGPLISDAASVAEIVTEVGRYAVANPGEDWIVGASYDPTLADGGIFDAAWLDAAVPDRPVVLRARDYHGVWCNSEAMRRVGVHEHTPQPRLGEIVRRPDGTPAGTFFEWDACDLVLRQLPQRAPGDLRQAVRHAAGLYRAAGVTWVQDAWVDPGSGMIEAYLAHALDRPALRVAMALRADPQHWREQRADFGRHRAEIAAAGVDDLLDARTVKFFADGVIESGTAMLVDGYADDRSCAGMAVWEPAALAEAVTAVDRDGFQVHIHAIGDGGVRSALDAIEQAIRVNPGWARRPVIAHVQLVHPADLPRFAALGVIANFEPLWAQLDPAQTELTLPRLGEPRGNRQYPMRTLLATGARLSFGSDWPVSSLRPLDGIPVAMTRQTTAGEPAGGWVPGERLSLAQALHAYSAGSAYQASAQDRRGSLRLGMRPDLLWLAADPFTVAPDELPGIAVVGTQGPALATGW